MADRMPADSFDVTLTHPGSVAAVPARWYAAEGNTGGPVLILAHGAGAPQSHPWMVGAACALAARGLVVVTFDFPYMAARRKLPDRAPVLAACWLDAIAAVRARAPGATPLLIGGKSMGGRMATHVAAHHADRAGAIAGLVLLGYPLHPPGKPDQRRDAHLPRIGVPALFVQGTRDAFGGPDDLKPAVAPLGGLATIHAVDAGDHSFAVPRASGRTTHDVLEGLWDAVAAWVLTRLPR